MLVLSRTSGQRILIGEEIIVTVLGSKNGQVRLGLEAPARVKILREEIQTHEATPKDGISRRLLRRQMCCAG
jgi:carbon storage regulator